MSSIFEPRIPLTRNQRKIPDHLHWNRLEGAAVPLAIANAYKKHQGPLIVLTTDTAEAYQLEKEISFFLDKKTDDLHIFPHWETLAYDHFSPHQDIVSKRLETLYLLSRKQPGIFLVPISTLLQRLAPVDYIGKHLLYLQEGERLDTNDFRRNLEKAGYLHVGQVMSHSEFCIRGSIIDMFPMGSDHPYRIDLFDDEIDSIRLFDPSTQRSLDKVSNIRLLPAREFPTDKEALSLFRTQFLNNFDQIKQNEADSVLSQVSKGTMPGGVEYYLPLFFKQTASLFDYLHEDAIFVYQGGLNQAIEKFCLDVENRYEQYKYNLSRPLLTPTALFLHQQEVNAFLKAWPWAKIDTKNDISKDLATTKGKLDFKSQKINNIGIDTLATNPYAAIQAEIKQANEQCIPVMFVAESAGHKESLINILLKANIELSPVDNFSQYKNIKKPGICVGSVEDSVKILDGKNSLLLITEKQLLGHKVSRRKQKNKTTSIDESAIIRNLAELSEGSPVVHLEHGVGRFLGLQTLDAGGVPSEYLSIEYAKQAKLYVPVSSLHLISRYSGGDAEHAPLHHLGNDTWSKAKQKAAEKVRDVAAQLLDVYAKRAAKPGFAYPINWTDYQKFADSFPYQETADQEQAINAVLQDMGSKNAMDRLVCGDVGFGKTEVAMRAAYICAMHGKQVAILVPTTLLAQQHYENFKDRFAQFPVNIEVVSRFVSSKDQNQVLEQLQSGKVDIVVGTHKLLQNDVTFNDLGLVIIDEEHRFGVRQKEKFKALRADVDILTLTATPIPRTLNMALSGMRDLSIIATPPAKRLPVKTFVLQKHKDIVREAIMREILRGGQVYFLHNEVKSIEQTAADISEVVPEARIAIGHGQMRERELENVMNDFYHQRYNVLVCSTIIETGIDVATANTIIINRADHLGLAQLHQLRGRVGRSHHQAYAYLLTPHPRRMTKDATKRLEAIASLEDLGAGFALATHDLEIRGAGELLGDDQSGQINTVGFNLYMEMLEAAVEALKEGKEPSLTDTLGKQTEVELRIPALFPEDYIGDVNMRLAMYKKLANCKSNEEIDDIQIELIDRFGLLPVATKNLVQMSVIKLLAKRLGINKIEANERGGSIEFAADTKVDAGYLIQLIQSKPSKYRFDGPQKLRFIESTPATHARSDFVFELCEKLAKASNVK
ncbi:transcription-repair coupling factor [Glaciecola petra]|uniref:Transcription-repair-coupling factor n=1 Tax=Glaciecola petra TaxID=3075602 RepID=A0ABU2ZNF7_9ALTE|nr:transcription-repair coupling factor [Aestuariibacter sp. P117]MDT0594168.1 transcription-repair coupling factor [Aestuariibacter sp. P117]